jgi:hypothetical protein
VVPAQYDYEWGSALKYLKINPDLFDPDHNMDYRTGRHPKEDQRGGCPYYLPLGWYRHALKVSGKYGIDPTWIGMKNAAGEWPVAYHGTKAVAALPIITQGLSTDYVQRDVMQEEAIEQKGLSVAGPGVYVATHCEGGSYPSYTTPFSVPTSDGGSEKYSLVFQCRVKPGEFTNHTGPVKEGEAWRFVDSSHIRPYGLLLKKEKDVSETDIN